jgi:lysosomal acid lipase/cholesteryl ester hydrolase
MTGSAKVGYVGHSQGTTTMFALLSAQPDFSSKLTTFVALAPVVSVASIRVKFLNVLAEYHLDEIIALFGIKDFLPQLPAVLRILKSRHCSQFDTLNALIMFRT